MTRVRYSASRRSAWALLPLSVATALSVAACDREAAAPLLPIKLAFTEQPRSATAGAPVGPVAVTVEDASGDPVSRVSDTVTLALARDSSGATLAGPTTVTAGGGVATFDGLSVAVAGSYALVATAPGYASARSAPFTVSPGAAARLAFLSAPAVAHGQVAFAPAVQVAIEDSLGNTVTSATASVTLALGASPNGGTLSGTATAAASGGVAAFAGLSIDDPGAGYTLVATSGTLTSASSAPFDVHIAFASVSSASDHSCGVTLAGAAYCWGLNGRGELGNGGTANSATPVAVRGGLRFATVSAGPSFTCAVTTAGAAYCWGYNGDGELGSGSTAISSSTPTAVSGGLTFTAVASGAFGNCALTTTGAAYCWGADNYGQLGIGSFSPSSVPVAVSGGITFSQITAGFGHICALTAAGAAYCWGNNAFGQLGNNSTALSQTPVQVSAGSVVFTSLSAGAQHTCAVATISEVYCWGYNADGEFGNGGTGNDSTPVEAQGALYLNLAAVAAGQASTCALTAAGAPVCGGAGAQGQLGDGSTARSLVPVAVAGGLTFKALVAAAEGQGVCGLTASGALYCWGFNSSGQLGNGTTGENLVPEQVIQ